MITAKTTVVLILAYVLALAAGTTSGVLEERLRNSNAALNTAPLAAQLDLTPAQCDLMRKAWEDVRATDDDCYKRAQSVERARDQALVDMMTDEQKARFSAKDKAFAQQYSDLVARRDQAFHDAISKTEDVLTPTQRAKYEQIVRDRIGTPAANGAAGDGATTVPSTEDFRP